MDHCSYEGTNMHGLTAPIACGIFGGMNSSESPDPEKVLEDLGEPFIHALIDAVDGAREDYREFQAWHPDWFPSFFERFTASFLHERIWDRLTRATSQMEHISVYDREPTRQLWSGTHYLIRLKRHRSRDRISTYPTKAARELWSGQAALDGLESISLAVGYYWDSELREVGDTVVSYRSGTDNPVWAIRLHKSTDAAADFTWKSIDPTLPEINIGSVLPNQEEESSS